jgi:predicted transcriptional regulator
MTLTIKVSDETERKLNKMASRIGQPVDEFVNHLIEREVSTKTFAEILAPVHEHSRNAGYTEEELDEFFEGLRNEVYKEKQARQTTGSRK